MCVYEIYVNNEFKCVVYAEHKNNALVKYMENNPLRLSDKIEAVFLHECE